VYNSGDEDAADGAAVAADGAAVAADGDGAPQQVAQVRRPKDTAPKPDAAYDRDAPGKWDLRNSADHVGNIGWLFGNWGLLPKAAPMRAHIETVLKKNPAMVIGLAECQPESEELLSSPPSAGDPEAPPHSLESRNAYSYYTLRGKEPASVLAGLRCNLGGGLEYLHWERREEGQYKSRSGGGNRAFAYSRCLIVKVRMSHQVGFMGSEHNMLVMHLHNHLANNKFGPTKLNAFWDWLHIKIQEYHVKVLMGDFNMALFRVIPELRSRGVTIDLAAWYPWKSAEGVQMADSCGIFFIDTPGEYTLFKGLKDLHADDSTGILWKAEPVVAGHGSNGGADGFHRMRSSGGPGQPLKTYLPKDMGLREKLLPSLEPSTESKEAMSQQAAATANAKGRAAVAATPRTCVKIREKRLEFELWRLNGDHYKASHYPICVFTNNVGRRSPERLEARQQKARGNKQGKDYEWQRWSGWWRSGWEAGDRSGWEARGSDRAGADDSNRHWEMQLRSPRTARRSGG
jgi:hypothetical protein